MLPDLHPPDFAGLGQFDPYLLALEEQANCAWPGEMLCIVEQQVQAGAGSRRDDIEGRPFRCGFDPVVADIYRDAKPISDQAQEVCLLAGGLEQRRLNPVLEHHREHEARKACPAAHIGQGLGLVRNQRRQLSAVPDMAPPHIL